MIRYELAHLKKNVKNRRLSKLSFLKTPASKSFMKVRIYSPFLPFPITEGAYRVIYDQVFSLTSLGHEVELVTWKDSEGSFQTKRAHWARQGNLPVIKRLSLPKEPSRWGRVLSSFFVEEASPELFYYPRIQAHSLRSLGRCDLAIYHYSFAYHWLKTPNLLPEESKRVVHFHNLESDLFVLRSEDSRWPLRWMDLKNAKKLRAHEEQLASLVQELWFLSPVDQKRWETQHGWIKEGLAQERKDAVASPVVRERSVKVKLIPPTYTAEISKWMNSVQAEAHGNAQGLNLGFVGGMRFKPNQDSAEWIMKQLVPELEKRHFQGRILILGSGAQDFFKAELLPSWVEILPEGTEMTEFLKRLSWMLVPHVSGSGVRIKLLDALAQKIPVFATKEAVERLHPEIQKSPLIFSSSSASEWADRVVSEEPFESRLKWKDLSFPEAMRGDRVYQNV